MACAGKCEHNDESRERDLTLSTEEAGQQPTKHTIEFKFGKDTSIFQ